MASESMAPTSRFILPIRLAVALAQGLLLYALVKWRGDSPQFGLDTELWKRLLDTLCLFALYAPLPLLFGLGNLPARRLALWSIIGAVAIFAFGWFAAAPAWRDAPTATWLFALIVIYIVHEFVQAAYDDGRRIASYATYFDRAWRHGFQALLSLIFVGAFWVVILLGATLFGLIGLEIVKRMFNSEFFAWVATPLAFALGLHLTDADTGLTRGARQIGLALLSWLAILMTLILAAFLAALPFTGLEPLWDTKRATVLLLNAAATMILLINAGYQAGDPPRSAILRAVVRFSALPLAGVVVLAALGLWLRVDQYGFTPARVLASAELAIVAVYAVGYLAAAVSPGGWLALVRPVNIGAALFVAMVLSLLMTPALDPARVAVADQVARLERGTVEPDDFDFGFLADRRSGHWGEKALAALAARSGSERDERIALLAKNPVIQPTYPYRDETFSDRRTALVLIGDGEIPDAALLPLGSDDPVSQCVSTTKAYAEGRRLEEERARQRERLGQRATETESEAALRRKGIDRPDVDDPDIIDPDEGRCPARLVDVDFDGDEDLLILTNPNWTAALRVAAIVRDAAGWRYIGMSIPEVAENDAPAYGDEIDKAAPNATEQRAKRRADFQRLTVAPHKWRDVIFGGAPIRVNPMLRGAPMDAARIEILDDGALPEAALAAPAYNARHYCRDKIACFGRMLAPTPDGAPHFALFAVDIDGEVSLAFFDMQTGAFVADGRGRAGQFDQGGAITDMRERAAHLLRERRALVAGATFATPQIGDLALDGNSIPFQYVLMDYDEVAAPYYPDDYRTP